MEWPSSLCSIFFARAPVLGLCFFVPVIVYLAMGTYRACQNRRGSLGCDRYQERNCKGALQLQVIRY